MKLFECIFIISLIKIMVAHYNIIQEENLYDYNIMSESTTRTYTECILKCDYDQSCSFVSINEYSDGSFSCSSFAEKLAILNLSNPDEFTKVNRNLALKKIDTHITLVEQLNETQPPCTPWSSFSRCDVTCGNGTLFRERTCLQKCPEGERKEYVNEKEAKNCINEPCIVPCPAWGDFSQCSVTCGNGTMFRERTCPDGTTEMDLKVCTNDPCEDPKVLTGDQGADMSINCDPNSKIVILSATYGNHDRVNCVRDVIDIVNGYCANKQSCSFNGNDHIFGDSCFGYPKYSTITYVCRAYSPPQLVG